MKVEIRDRLTVVQQVYHQVHGKQPRYYDSRFFRELSSHEVPYERSFEVGYEWTPLDVGWLKENGVGMLVIVNDEGHFKQTIPTPSEKSESSKRILELGHLDSKEDIWPEWLILPKESMRAFPTNIDNLRIRCQFGTARYTIQAFPR